MATYHIELRNFPRVETRFNQTGEELGAIVLLWVDNRIIEMDDEKWAPWESTIKIIEGPPIPIGGLSLGRGWNTAQREGTDVTERVLDEARKALADGSAYAQPVAEHDAPGPPETAPAEDYPSRTDEPPPSDPFTAPAVSPEDLAIAAELAGVLGGEPARLLAAWRAVAARTGGLAPSESLALAERELQRQSPPQG